MNCIDDFAMNSNVSIRFTAVFACAFVALGATALESSAFGEEERQANLVQPLPKYQQECAACHIAYPPGMLPADSWKRILNNLDHHFGIHASLDVDAVKLLESWTTAHAQTAARGASAPPGDRITRSKWFMSAHDEIPASTWRLAGVKSASNCAACHTRADQGNFDERYIRIPN
ncbi:diheme cytochrome c [Paraburkholderia heleia]|uniref:diheme cytochrome c n=1 Tax=Paraburkholderia heleia TaxID=634127 RepID=UPI0031E415F2